MSTPQSPAVAGCSEMIEATTSRPQRQPALYEPSPLKRKRRTQSQMATLLGQVHAILAEYNGDQVTIRHLFYRLVGIHAIPKLESAYKNLNALTAKWRRSGDLDYDVFVDSTRFFHRVETFDGVHEALRNAAICYRRNLWANQRYYVELWCEKEAIIALLWAVVVEQFGVPLFACRGYPSISSLSSAAKTFKRMQAAGKEVRVFYFGDYDPSGVDIDRSVVEVLERDFDVHGVVFQRIAITPELIAKYQLPTRPAKPSDTRARGWVGGCVEVDTLPPATLRKLAEDAITSLIDQREWQALLHTEKLERESMLAVSAAWSNPNDQEDAQ